MRIAFPSLPISCHSHSEWVGRDCTLTLNAIKNKCLQEWPQIGSIGLSTIDRVLNGFHYTFKRVSFVPEARNTPEVIDSRYDYAINYTQLMLEKEKLFFIWNGSQRTPERIRWQRGYEGLEALRPETLRLKTRRDQRIIQIIIIIIYNFVLNYYYLNYNYYYFVYVSKVPLY